MFGNLEYFFPGLSGCEPQLWNLYRQTRVLGVSTHGQWPAASCRLSVLLTSGGGDTVSGNLG